MRTKLLSIVSMCIICTSAAFAQSSSFPFDTDAKDANKKINATVSSSGLSFENDAARGSVINFDGTNGFITMDPAKIYSYDALTYNLWFKWTTTVKDQWWVRLWDFGWNSTENTANKNHDVNFCTLYQDGKLKWHIHPRKWDNGSDTILASKDTIKLNQWYMLTVTHDATKAQMYLNGVLQESRGTNGVTPKAFDSLVNAYIGKSCWPDALFTGKMDNFAIYSSVLSDAEITALFGTGTAVHSNVIKDVQIYNNQNNIAIQINSLKKAAVEVYDIRGVKVASRSNLSTYTSIGSLKTGVYIVRVLNGADVSSQKVVIR